MEEDRGMLEASRAGPAASASAPAATVLVVEDQHMVRQMTARLLRSKGYVVLETAGGHEALELEGRHPGPIDLLLTDVLMPKMSGEELAVAFSARRPAVRVLFVSGYSAEALPTQGAPLAVASDFLSKPYSVKELLLRVRRLLAQKD
ncbi:MAG: response regulator [Planctomycetes bacterium]|nr:response regulator [Planctomycetota bacterium]